MAFSLGRATGGLLTRRTMTMALGTLAAGMTGRRAAVARPSGCGAPADIGDGWRIAKPEDVGIDGARLCATTGWLDSFGAGNIHSILVVRHGALVFEHYRKASIRLGINPSSTSSTVLPPNTISGRQQRALPRY
jgi:hypothetical protein